MIPYVLFDNQNYATYVRDYANLFLLSQKVAEKPFEIMQQFQN